MNQKLNTKLEDVVMKLSIGTEGSSKDVNNYIQWTEMIQKLVLPKYGKEFSTLVFTNQLAVQTPPVEANYLPQILGPDPANPGGPQIIQPHGFSNAIVAELRLDCYKTWNKRRTVVETVEGPKFFAEIRSLLTDNSLAIVESQAGYQAAQNAQDFGELWMMIRQTHYFTQYRGANPQAVLRERNLLMKSYLTTMQRPDQTPESYFKEFKQTRSKLRSLGEPDPNNANDVQHFLSNLDPLRYEPLLIELENRVNSGMANVYPANVALACELVIRWKPVPSYNFSKSSSIGKNVVYITKSSDSEEDEREAAVKIGTTDKKKKSLLKPPRFIFPGDTRTCPLCDQVGHVLRYCGNNELGLSKPTVEDQQKQTDYQAKRKAAARKPKPKPVDTEIFMTSFYSDSDEESDESTDRYGNAFAF